MDKEILPHATALEHADAYPQDIVDGMKEMGLFGLTIPEEYGGLGESLLTYALVVEQIARGWMSVSGVINTHFIVAHMITQHGTDEQKQRYLPRMAAGEMRGSFSMSEPDLGSDVAAIKTQGGGRRRRLRDRRRQDVADQRRHVQPDRRAGQDRRGRRRSRTRTSPASWWTSRRATARSRPGSSSPARSTRWATRAWTPPSWCSTATGCPPTQILGGKRGGGFAQMMDGVEVGRVNVAARACGISIRAFELAVEYAQQRRTFGKPIAEHQAIAFKLAEMATKVEAAHLMMVNAARLKDSGERNDVEAGMAKLLASEYCAEVTQESFRIHGGYGYSKEYEIERLMREAPFLLIGEGTSEIQKTIISRGLLREYKLR